MFVRPMFMKLTCLFVGLALAAAPGAQPVSIGTQEEQRAQELLNSTHWVEKAWGTFIAGRLHSQRLQERLIEEFRDAVPLRNAAPSSEERAFVDTLFDAAIVGEVAIPSTLLQPFAENWIAPVLILLSRNKDSEGMLLAFRADTSRDMVWLTANNLLSGMKSQRWYSSIWKEINITHKFTVVDSEDLSGFGGAAGGVSCGDGVALMPRDFPPVGLYALEDHGGRGRVVIAEGPTATYYHRTVVPTNAQVGIGSCTGQLDRAAARIGYLAQLGLEPAEKAEQQFHAVTQVSYTSSDAFLREAERSMAEQADYIVRLTRAGEREGLRPPDILLRMIPEIVDKRKNPRIPLPAIGPRTISLR
jgi:hypothetical protein